MPDLMNQSVKPLGPVPPLELHCPAVSGTMKFEDLLMEQSEERQKRADLEDEVAPQVSRLLFMLVNQ